MELAWSVALDIMKKLVKAPFSKDATFQETQNFRFVKTCCAEITSQSSLILPF